MREPPRTPAVFDHVPQREELVTVNGIEYRVIDIRERKTALRSDTSRHILCMRHAQTGNCHETFFNMETLTASPYVYKMVGI